MKRIFSATAVALLLLAGCSTGGGGSDAAKTSTTEAKTTTVPASSSTTAPTTTTTEDPSAGTVPLKTWAKGFCGSFSAWTSGIEDLGKTAERDIGAASSPAEARDAVVATFEGAATLTTTLIGEVSAQDPPKMKDGEGMVAAFTAKFQEFADVIEASRSRAEAVDVNAADFGDQVKKIYADFENDFAAIGNSFGEIDRRYPDPAFQQALTDACSL